MAVPKPPGPYVFLDGRVYRRIALPGKRATWAEGVYLDEGYAEVKRKTGTCVVFERTEVGAVEDVFVVTSGVVLVDKARAVVAAQRCKLRPEPPPEIGTPL